MVVSTAIPEDNPELAARAAGAGASTAAQLLGEVVAPEAGDRDRRHARQDHHLRHGRARAASACGRDPAFLIGGELRSEGTNAAWGEGDWIVVEADESDRSFLELPRDVAVVTNIELDHHHTYRSLAELQEAFDEFAAPAGVRIAGPGVELEGALTYGIDGATCAPRRWSCAARLALRGRGGAGGARGARPPQRAERAGGPGRLPRGRACRSRRPRRRWPASPAPAGGSRSTAPRPRARGCSTTTPITRPRCAPRSRRPARWAPAALVACFQPHLFSRTRELARDVRRGAGAGRPGGRARRLPGARAGRGLPRGQRADGGPGRRRRRAAAGACCGPRPSTRPPAGSAAELGEGDVLLTLGAGDVDRVWRGPASSRPTASRRDFPLARLTTVRTGGPADFYARAGHAGAAGGAAGLGRGRGPPGRSGRLGIESPGSRCRIPRTRHEARRRARLDRARWPAPALRRRRPAAPGRGARRARGPDRPGVRREHPRHRRRRGEDERQRLRRRPRRACSSGSTWPRPPGIDRRAPGDLGFSYRHSNLGPREVVAARVVRCWRTPTAEA